MKIIFTLAIALSAATAFAQNAPLIDDYTLKVATEKKALIEKECPQLRGMKLATCVKQSRINDRLKKRGSDAYAADHYQTLNEKQALEKVDQLERLAKKARSNVFARELVEGELFQEDIEREIDWLELNKLNKKRRYQVN